MALVALSTAYFLNEIGAEYGLLSQAHYDMVLDCLTKRDRYSRAAKAGVTLRQVPPDSPDDIQRIADSATQVVVAQSTVAAILEFLVSQVAGHLSDAMGRRPILVASAMIMSVCKAAPVLWPSLPSVWLAKSGGEAANTIVTNTLLSAVSDLFASNVQAYGSAAGRLRALGGISWVIGPTVGMWLSNRSGPRLSYVCSTVAALGLSLTCACGLPETCSRTAGPRVAFGELRLSSFVPIGFLSIFTRKGAYAQCDQAVPKLAVSLALMRLAFFGTYDVQDSHVRRILGWSSTRLSTYRTVEGITDFSQGALAELSLRVLGNMWGSVVGPLSNGIAFLIQGFASPIAWRRQLMWVGVALLSVPPEVVPEALLVNAANTAGVGEGKLQSDLSNLTALMKMAGPPVFGQSYFLGLRQGFPGLWGLVAFLAYAGGMAAALSTGIRQLRK